MIFQTRTSHMVGTAIRIRGALYPIDGDGFVEIPDDVSHYLSNDRTNWRVVVNPNTTTEPVPEVVVPEIEVVEDPVPEEKDSEWPDPTEDMHLEYLQTMAEAYEVKYKKNWGKSALVKHILNAMYPKDVEE